MGGSLEKVQSRLKCSILLEIISIFLVNLFLTKLVRISGFSSLFSEIVVFLYPPTDVLKNTAVAEKREEKTEILTNLVGKRLTRFGPGQGGV